MELDLRVVVDEVEQPPRAVDEGCHRAVRVHVLVAIGDHAVDLQVDQAIREHLGVHAEVELVAEAPQHGVGNAADAHLQRRAILDQRRDLLTDGCLDRGLGSGCVLVQRTFGWR